MQYAKSFLVGLYPYRVSLYEEPGDRFILHFDCFAEDCEHAEEQAKNAYPEAVINHCAMHDFRPTVH